MKTNPKRHISGLFMVLTLCPSIAIDQQNQNKDKKRRHRP